MKKNGLRINLKCQKMQERNRRSLVAQKVKSAEENHEENQSLFADTVRTNESTIGEPVENKLMKAGKKNFWHLDPSHFSSWLRLTRLVAWVCRFLHNCRTSKEETTQGELTHEEIRHAEVHIVREVQQDECATEYQQLLKRKANEEGQQIGCSTATYR